MQKVRWLRPAGILFVGLIACRGAGSQEALFEGKPAEHWIKLLASQDMDVRIHASTALMTMREKAVPPLVRAIKSDNSSARIEMIMALGWIGTAAAPAMPVLEDLLRDKSTPVRVAAASAILAIDCSRRTGVLPVLIEALSPGSPAASMAAATIGGLGSRGAPAVPALITLLGASDENLRIAAATALWKIGPAAERAIPALEEVQKEGGTVGETAATALQGIRGGAPTAPDCKGS
jgi:HEAT repeat protein